MQTEEEKKRDFINFNKHMCCHAQKITECYNKPQYSNCTLFQVNKNKKEKNNMKKKNAPHTRKIAIETFSRVKRAWFTLIGNLPPNSLKKQSLKC